MKFAVLLMGHENCYAMFRNKKEVLKMLGNAVAMGVVFAVLVGIQRDTPEKKRRKKPARLRPR